jgi:hypothetical protein
MTKVGRAELKSMIRFCKRIMRLGARSQKSGARSGRNCPTSDVEGNLLERSQKPEDESSPEFWLLTPDS